MPSAEQLACGIHTDDQMMIARDPTSGDWLIEAYDGEEVLLTLPSTCTLEEVKRAASIYSAAFKAGFSNGYAVADNRGIA